MATAFIPFSAPSCAESGPGICRPPPLQPSSAGERRSSLRARSATSQLLSRWVAALLLGPLAFCSQAGRVPSSSSSLSRPGVQLVQSIPEGTGLQSAELPYTLDVWLRMIRSARKTIDLAQYYVASAPGQPLEAVLSELERAAERGVRIRVLLSQKLLASYPDSYARLRALPNTTVRAYDIAALTGGVLHAKYWIIDGDEPTAASSQAFVGSQNMDWRSLTQIHELGVLIHDRKVIFLLATLFAADWSFAETGRYPALAGPRDDPTPTDQVPIELLASPPQLTPPSIGAALPALLRLIAEAQTSLRIQLLDYSLSAPPEARWDELDAALRKAASRGVRVELLVSHWNTSEPDISHLKELAQLPNFAVRIATIPELPSGFIPHARVTHSKYMVVDNTLLWLGTSNWARRYFYSSRNVELILRDAALARTGSRVFQTLWDSRYCQPIEPGKTYPPPRRSR